MRTVWMVGPMRVNTRLMDGNLKESWRFALESCLSWVELNSSDLHKKLSNCKDTLKWRGLTMHRAIAHWWQPKPWQWPDHKDIVMRLSFYTEKPFEWKIKNNSILNGTDGIVCRPSYIRSPQKENGQMLCCHFLLGKSRQRENSIYVNSV